MFFWIQRDPCTIFVVNIVRKSRSYWTESSLLQFYFRFLIATASGPFCIGGLLNYALAHREKHRVDPFFSYLKRKQDRIIIIATTVVFVIIRMAAFCYNFSSLYRLFQHTVVFIPLSHMCINSPSSGVTVLLSV